MATINYQNTTLTWSIDSETGFNVASPGIQTFLTSLTRLHDLAGTLQSFNVTKTGDIYRLQIEPFSFEISFKYENSVLMEKFKNSDWVDAHIACAIFMTVDALLLVMLQYKMTRIEFIWT